MVRQRLSLPNCVYPHQKISMIIVIYYSDLNFGNLSIISAILRENPLESDGANSIRPFLFRFNGGRKKKEEGRRGK